MPFGIPAAMLLTSAIGTGGSLIGGLMNKNKGRTSTSTPTYTPAQTRIQNTLAGKLEAAAGSDPGARLAPLKTQALTGVNRTYDSIGERMNSDLTARGFGQSGKVATNKRKLETSRAGDIAGVENQFAGMEIEEQNNLMRMMQQFGFGSAGQSTTTPGPTAGDIISDSTGSAAETAMFMYALSKMGGLGGPAINT